LRALCIYATHYGTTGEIAQRVCEVLKKGGIEVEAYNVKDRPPPLSEYDLIILGTYIQAGSWAKEAIDYMKRNREELASKKIAFFVACGDYASPDMRESAQRRYIVDALKSYPSFKPISTSVFAGAFSWERYNFIIKTLMKSISSKKGAKNIDTSRIQDFRDWTKIEGWASELAALANPMNGPTSP
jgi:menaquinone-dependent protoporphyrinogen oxidase